MSGSAAPATVWVNGQRRQGADASVSARDRGLMLADGLFETMHVRGRRAFRLDRHLSRLGRGLDVLAIPAPPQLDAWLREAIETESDPLDRSLRVTVTRGAGGFGLAPPASPETTTIITVGPVPTFPESTYRAGLALHLASGCRNPRASTAGLKTLAYTDAVVALLEAQRAGADDALLLDTDGHCSEATASNLFVSTGSRLLTPPESCGALPGVTREAVIEIARAEGLAVEERAFGLDALLAAEEVFLTSSLRRLAPVVRVGTTRIGTGVPGSVTGRLAAAYDALVATECGA
jgi:branched-chain amino acid aminotransferase